MSATTAGIVLLAAGAALATLTAWAWWTDAHPATGRHHATTRWQRARGAWHATTGWARTRRERRRQRKARDAATISWVHDLTRTPNPGTETGNFSLGDLSRPVSVPVPSGCEHGWPGDNCGQAHPYIADPTPLTPPGAWLAATLAARWLVREAERLATRPWEHPTGEFARTALTDMLAGAT